MRSEIVMAIIINICGCLFGASAAPPGWSAPEKIAELPDWKCYTDFAVDASGTLHLVYSGEEWNMVGDTGYRYTFIKYGAGEVIASECRALGEKPKP